MACVMAKRHQKRGQKDLLLHALKARDKTFRGVNESVGATTSPQRSLEQGKRGLALRAAVAGKRDNAIGRWGQGFVEGDGHGDVVLLGSKERRSEAQLVEIGGRRAHRRRGIALKTTVRDVRGRNEHATHAAAPQVGEGVGQRNAHGPTARARADHHARSDRSRKLADERGHSRVVLLAREATGYDQSVRHSNGGRRAPRP